MMPVYEYKCEECGAIKADLVPWDKVRETDGQPTIICPVCGATAKKVLSVPAKPYVKV